MQMVDEGLKLLPNAKNYNTIQQVAHNEMKLTKVLFHMEKRGIAVDRTYIKSQFNLTHENALSARKKLEEYAGREFSDSPAFYKPLFDANDLKYPTTEKGNPSFSKTSLKGIKHPVIDTLFRYRKNYKLAHTYYRNYLELADKDHPAKRNESRKFGP